MLVFMQSIKKKKKAKGFPKGTDPIAVAMVMMFPSLWPMGRDTEASFSTFGPDAILTTSVLSK